MIDYESRRFWILGDDGNPTRVPLMEWAAWLETADRRIAWTELPGGGHVSTVFLSLADDVFARTPLMFETMVFGLKDGDATAAVDALTRRYPTKELAEQGHREVVESLSKGEE